MTGPRDMLLACHDRLRYFSELASLLATRLDASAEDVSDAARRLRTYFTVALPLHEADEELSLAPRLLSSSKGESVAESLGLMSEQHGLLHVVLDELVPSWTRLESEPSVLDAIANTLAGESRRLAIVLEVHLALEETTIFPWLEPLPRSERDEMLAEIRARRTESVMTQMAMIRA